MRDLQTILIRPIITEQSLKDAEKGKYTFEVDKSAGKPFIKQAIEKNFTVHVISLTTRILKGRKMRVGKLRREIEKPHIKKATAQLAKDEAIDLFAVVRTA